MTEKIIIKGRSVGKSTSLQGLLADTKALGRISNTAHIRIDEKGQVWHASNSEGVPTWVSTGPHLDTMPDWAIPRLKPIVIAVKVAIHRG